MGLETYQSETCRRSWQNQIASKRNSDVDHRVCHHWWTGRDRGRQEGRVSEQELEKGDGRGRGHNYFRKFKRVSAGRIERGIDES